MIWIIIPLIIIAIIIALTIRIVSQTERGLIERWGKYNRFANPGIHLIIPIAESMRKIDITEQMVDAKPQEIITKDNLNAEVDAQIYFKVVANETGVKASQYNVSNYAIQIVALARTTLRDIIGNMSFKDVNSKRGTINAGLAKELGTQTRDWGISIVRSELKQIEPPKNVQETMNQVLIAENEKIAAKDFATATETKADGEKRAAIRVAQGDKQAAVLRAEGEAEAIKLVNESADKYFRGNAVELKKLQTIRKSLENNTKIIASSDQPLMELVSKIAGIVSETKKEEEGA